ncbi:MAG: T9SS type A sorting domain-containing protein [Bacteroidota bacterium]
MISRVFDVITLSVVLCTTVASQVIEISPQIDTLFIRHGCTPLEIDASLIEGSNYFDTVRVAAGWNTHFWSQKNGYFYTIDFIIKDSLDQYTIELWFEPQYNSLDSATRVPFDSSFTIECGKCNLTLRLLKGTNEIYIRSQFCVSEGGLGIPYTNMNMKDKFQLYSNYPNPFNPTTTIKFSIPKTGYTTLKIFNITGREVVALVSEKLNPGTYTTKWDASNLSSGIYFYRLQSGTFIQTKKLVLMK